MKTKKRKKESRMHGRGRGTHGGGARKKRKGSGHRGGKGMSGSGKRADQKKTLINKLYGHNYFGKQGITSRGTKRDTRKRINLRDIQLNLKKYTKDKIVHLENYKILGEGEVTQKLTIKAKEASASAIEKVQKAGGEIILQKKEIREGKKEEVKLEKSSEKKNVKEVKKEIVKKK